jgi:hypothetical protein
MDFADSTVMLFEQKSLKAEKDFARKSYPDTFYSLR